MRRAVFAVAFDVAILAVVVPIIDQPMYLDERVDGQATVDEWSLQVRHPLALLTRTG